MAKESYDRITLPEPGPMHMLPPLDLSAPITMDGHQITGQSHHNSPLSLLPAVFGDPQHAQRPTFGGVLRRVMYWCQGAPNRTGVVEVSVVLYGRFRITIEAID
jgi:hypothetical protein